MGGNLYVCDVSGEVLVSKEIQDTASSSAEEQSWMTSFEEELTTFYLTEQGQYINIMSYTYKVKTLNRIIMLQVCICICLHRLTIY